MVPWKQNDTEVKFLIGSEEIQPVSSVDTLGIMIN